jgi:hypothetical protein
LFTWPEALTDGSLERELTDALLRYLARDARSRRRGCG